ncbi:hypothetical protein EV10_0026 [Prochlorococcus marinus str. SS51]|nr:hypothetical protein EV10_0026 [Prochlorococcus marinus str. SS51]
MSLKRNRKALLDSKPIIETTSRKLFHKMSFNENKGSYSCNKSLNA